MAEVERAYSDLITITERTPFAGGVDFLYEAFRHLSKSDFLVPGKQFLTAFEIAAVAKWIYLNAPNRGLQSFDAGSLLNAYKSLWKEAENQADYPDDPAVIASFVLQI